MDNNIHSLQSSAVAKVTKPIVLLLPSRPKNMGNIEDM